MSNFCPDQGRTRVSGEAYSLYASAENPRPPALRAYASERERRSGQKGPFMDGNLIYKDSISLKGSDGYRPCGRYLGPFYEICGFIDVTFLDTGNTDQQLSTKFHKI